MNEPLIPPIIFHPMGLAERDGTHILALYMAGYQMSDGTKKDRRWVRKTINDPWVEVTDKP